MIVVIAAGGTELRDQDGFRAFEAQTDLDHEQLAAALTETPGILLTEDDHVWIAPAFIEFSLDEAVDLVSWREGMAGMVSFARGKGWTDSEGRIRAHIVRPVQN